MANKRVKPKLNVPSNGKVIRTKVPAAKRLQTGPYLSRLTVLWVNNNGVTFNTSGFFEISFTLEFITDD